MRINTIFIIILSLILNSCAVYSQDKIEQKLLKKIEGQKYNENLNLNELYISEGHFVCSKSQEPINRLESTSDGINDNFLYITNNGRMFFSSLPTSKYNKRDISNKEFDIPNAVFYKKNGNYIVERKSVTHTILGIGGGYLISKGKIYFKNDKIIIVGNSDKEHCDIYKKYE